MAFGAALVLDPATTEVVRALWLAQLEVGLPSFMTGVDYPPHITLMMAEDGDMPGLKDALSRLAHSTQPVAVAFAALGVFPAEFGVVYLAPTANQALLDLHVQFWAAAEGHVTGPFEHYRPGVWVPHVTLAYQLLPGQLARAAEFLAGCSWPRAGSLTGIIYGDFKARGSSRLETVLFNPG